MSFVVNILTPIVLWVCIGGFTIWVLYILFRITKKINSPIALFLKYKVFRYDYDESYVQWCIKANENKMLDVDIVKMLLIKGISDYKIREILYIRKQLHKLEVMKGGINENEQKTIRNGVGKAKSTGFPEI